MADYKGIVETSTAMSKEEMMRRIKEIEADHTGLIKQKIFENFIFDEGIGETVFSASMFISISFIGVLQGAEMVDCVFQDCKFDGTRGHHISFSNSLFINCTFNNARIPKADFTKCEFIDTQAINCVLNYCNFSLSNYVELKIENCKTENTLFECSEILRVQQDEHLKEQLVSSIESFTKVLDLGINNFDDSKKLEGAAKMIQEFIDEESEKLSYSDNMKKIELCDLEYMIEEHERVVDSPVKVTEGKIIDLSCCNFHGTNFQEHNLSRIDFSHSILTNCCFAGCDLSGCDFSNCDMSNAILFNAHFNQNVFEGTKLENIILDNKNREAFTKAGILKVDEFTMGKTHEHNDNLIEEDSFM